MEQKSAAGWSELRNRATAAIKRGAICDERGVSRLFQVAVLPSFDVATSWEVFFKRDKEAVSHFALLTTWDQSNDAAKFRTPTERLRHPPVIAPTIRTRRIALPSEPVAAWCKALRSTSIPTWPGDHVFGMDGVFYRFAAGDPFMSVTLDWWEDGPDEWAEFTAAVRNVLAALEKLAPVSESEGGAGATG